VETLFNTRYGTSQGARGRCQWSHPFLTCITEPRRQSRLPLPCNCKRTVLDGSSSSDTGRLCATIMPSMHKRTIARRFLLACLTLLEATTASSGASRLGQTGELQLHAGFGFSEPPFAIGDFDGDNQPDLATVQGEPEARQVTRYSIQLQLTLGTRPAIGLTAPFGGLLLSAKDVNGDSALDLVVRTALDARLVAVLVNDGYGNFSVAAEGSFPELTAKGISRVQAPTDPSSKHTPILPSRCPSGEARGLGPGFDAPASSQKFLIPEQHHAALRSAGASSGRAPPR
jgi:hypothetical protein